jgi:uncharacterized membrane protein YgdD (TMEM256/DUF423 family)
LYFFLLTRSKLHHYQGFSQLVISTLETYRPIMTATRAARIAAAMGLLAVALGAFGAHGLKDILKANETAAVWDKAAFYHFIHAVMLYVLASRDRFLRGPWWCFLIGIVIFSGSLYLLAITRILGLGAITPIGGISFMAGWLWLLFQPGMKTSDRPSTAEK